LLCTSPLCCLLPPSVVYSHRHHRALHSFPTRRSSDLIRRRDPALAPGKPYHGLGIGPCRRARDAHYGFDGRSCNAREEGRRRNEDRKSTRLNSSHVKISYAVFCLKKKKKQKTTTLIKQ